MPTQRNPSALILFLASRILKLNTLPLNHSNCFLTEIAFVLVMDFGVLIDDIQIVLLPCVCRCYDCLEILVFVSLFLSQAYSYDLVFLVVSQVQGSVLTSSPTP